MPNWCSNQVTINGPKPVIDEIKSVLTDSEHNLLNYMRPMPQALRDTSAPNDINAEEMMRLYGAADWYNWCVNNWGTKWDISEPFIGDDTEEDSITFSFDTAWAPPVEAFRHWAERDGRVTYRLSYYEPGMAFVGWDSYDGEYFDEDYVEHGQDPDRYWEMAEQEFDVDRSMYEEPEPLTEWYTEGVREKGLE